MTVGRATQEARWGPRSVGAALLGGLGVILLSVSVVAVWAHATVLDSSKVAELTGDVLAEPDFQAAVAARVADDVFAAIDVESIAEDLLVDRLDPLAPGIAAGLRSAVERALTALLANDGVQQSVAQLVERAHDAAVDLLRGDGLIDGVAVVDGAVTVNLLPLVARGLTAVQSFGLLSEVEIPELTADGDPDEQRAELSSALGRPLPDDFGQVVVYDSSVIGTAGDAVSNAQRMLVLAERAVVLIVVSAIVLLVAAVLVARNRLGSVLFVGLGSAVAMVVVRAAAHLVVEQAPGLAAQPGGAAAIDALTSAATESLLRLTGIVALCALTIALVAILLRQHVARDLLTVTAFAIAVAPVAVAGLSLATVVIGALFGIAAAIVLPRLRPPSMGTGAAPSNQAPHRSQPT